MTRGEFFVPGLADEEFIRETAVPMTKNEVRVLSLAKLRLFPGAVVYDVGAGTGSISIECKLLFPSSQVLAVELDPRALHLIKLNCQKFGVDLQLVEGRAPEALTGLPAADRIFIGGSGGNLSAILEASDQNLNPGGWIVINSITLKNSALAWEVLETKGYAVEAVQVNIAVSSQRGQTAIWQARNPVTIISGRKGAGVSAVR